jgi:Phospholipase_D-nuclease N-terminal
VAGCKVQAVRGFLPYAEEGMAARKQWSDLSERTRRFLIAAAAAEGILKVVALIDIKRRPAGQVRGPKWLWAAVVTVVSSAGVVPICYFLFGRRQPRSQPD